MPTTYVLCCAVSRSSPGSGVGGTAGLAEKTKSTPLQPTGTTVNKRLPLHLYASPSAQKDVMPELPPQPNLDHLRHQERQLPRDTQASDPGALQRMGAGSTQLTLSAAQLAIAHEYGWRSPGSHPSPRSRPPGSPNAP